MNEEIARQQVTAALDDIRRPSPTLLSASMAAIASKRSRTQPTWMVSAAAVLLAVAIVGGLLAANAARRGSQNSAIDPNQSGLEAIPGMHCTLPVTTDQGPGLITFPSGTFRPARLPAATATAYDPTTHRWLATQPQGISPDGKLVALLDIKKGGNQTLRLETSSGKLLYSHDLVMRILGWSSDGSLLVTAVDPDTKTPRLLRISSGGHAGWFDPLSNATTMWSFAAGQYVWGVALPYPGPAQARMIVRLDLATATIANWYAMSTGSFNDSGFGPILGLTVDGYPIVPDLNTDSQAGVVAITAPQVPAPIHIGNWPLSASSFWPAHAISDAHGMWLTTTDGQLYWSSGGSDFRLVKVFGSVAVDSFAGVCG